MDAFPSGYSGHKGWWMLFGVQFLLGLVLFHDFFIGAKVFAYSDIGADSHALFTPQLMHLADYVRQEGWPMWSFSFGLGAPFLYPADPLSWLSIMGGAQQVPALRIWVYFLKILIGAWAFHAFLRRLPVDPYAALIGSLAYTFSGYAVINGQWDPMASEVMTYPLLLWALIHRWQGGHRAVLPGMVVFCILCSGFLGSLCAFAFYVFILSTLVADDKRAHISKCLLGVAPLFLLGVAISAPVLLPNLLLLLDSPRVSGSQALFAQTLADAFSINDAKILLSELAGFFSKDLLGRGNQYSGWMNYLEGPVFYAGTWALLLAPQLWAGDERSRRIFLVGGGFLLLYLLFPAIRYSAFGFAVPYFRVSSLWITMLILLLAVMALDQVLRRQIDRRYLIVAALLVLVTPYAIHFASPVAGAFRHANSLLTFSVAGLVLLATHSFGRLPKKWLPWALLLLVGSEIVIVAYPAYHREPGVVLRGTLPYTDLSHRVIQDIQKRDPGFYRIEKTFNSISEADALAQGYFGAKSYGIHGSSVVRLYTGLGLIPETSASVNDSNWLPRFDQRFPLYSLVGVKYVLRLVAPTWPGFSLAGQVGDIWIHRNEFALPLGVIHYQQILESALKEAPGIIRDVSMLHGVVMERPLPELPVFSLASLTPLATGPDIDWSHLYLESTQDLRQSGLKLSTFGNNSLSGEITASATGVLVLSIPYHAGWAAKIDGAPVSTFRVNFGMTGISIGPGVHRLQMNYFPPGLREGFMVSVLALLLWLAVGALQYFYRSRTVVAPHG